MTQILVIEDDPTQRLLTSAVLRSAGYEVLEAVDGAHGLDLARHSTPDLIVCDVVMPGLNGYQLVEALKSAELLATIPVILLTAMAERSHVRIGMTTGADDYLLKPFRATELRHSVAALLAKRELQRKQNSYATDQRVLTALLVQKAALAKSYENQLVKELNQRWDVQPDVNSDLRYDNATVLLVDIFGTVTRNFPADESLGTVLRRVHQAASDSLYLFGALHLVAVGDHLLAVFLDSDKPGAKNATIMAVRSAFGLQKTVQATLQSMRSQVPSDTTSVPSVTIAVHRGPVQLLHLKDPLHGEESLTVATGQVLDCAKELIANARICSWEISASTTVTSAMPDQLVYGRRAEIDCFIGSGIGRASLEAIELLGNSLT